MRARIFDFPAHVDIQFRSTQVLRASLMFPVDVTPRMREVFAVKLQDLNRTGFGVSAVMTIEGIAIIGQVPHGAGPVTRQALDRTLWLVVEHARAVYPEVRKVEATGWEAV